MSEKEHKSIVSDFQSDLKSMKYGVSITDACIDWETTEKTILEAHDKLVSVLQSR